MRRLPQPRTSRERLSTADGDFLDLDWFGPRGQPIVILLHGLTGTSRSPYIQGSQSALAGHGLRSVAVNFRGCSGQPNQTSWSYHSGETGDLDYVYQILDRRYPETPLAAVGYSLGGNVLLKWLGERGDSVRLFAAAAVSVPLRLDQCANCLDRGFSRAYRDHLLRELKNYIRCKHNHLLTIGNHPEAEKLRSLGDLSRIHSFWEYDDRVVAPLYHFRDVHDYYEKSSSRQYLKGIHVPTLILQARDDPFMTASVLPEEHELSSFVRLEVSAHGGHVGFVSGPHPGRPQYWLEQRIPAFLQAELAGPTGGDESLERVNRTF